MLAYTVEEAAELLSISRAVDSSPTLRNKKDLIENFVDSVSASGEIDAEWRAFVDTRRTAELNQIIEDEKLKPEETRAFVESASRDGVIRTTGTAITKVMPATTRFSADGAHGEKKQRVLAKLIAFFERFLGLIPSEANGTRITRPQKPSNNASFD